MLLCATALLCRMTLTYPKEVHSKARGGMDRAWRAAPGRGPEDWRVCEAWRESRLMLRRGSDAPPSLPVPESETSAMSVSPGPPNTCAAPRHQPCF